jgi:hypothetical protein
MKEFLPDRTRQTMPTSIARFIGRGVIGRQRQLPLLRLRRRRYTLAPQFFNSRADNRKIVGGARLGHVSSDFPYRELGLRAAVNYTFAGPHARKIASAGMPGDISYHQTSTISPELQL